MRYFYLLLILILPIETYAQSDAICNNLYQLTCAPGEFDDGTGISRDKAAYAEELNQRLDEVNQKTKKQLATELRKPSSKTLREKMLSVTGLGAHPSCQNAQSTPSESCIKLLAQGGSRIVMSKLLSPEDESYWGLNTKNLADITALTDMKEFKDLERRTLEHYNEVSGLAPMDKKIRSQVFPRVKALIVEKIEHLVADPETKKKMIAKVVSVNFGGTDCSEELDEPESLSVLVRPEVFYVDEIKEVYFCGSAWLQNSSEFDIVHAIAHEMSHSIDPCNIAFGASKGTFELKVGEPFSVADDRYPFSGVMQCLRSERSANAAIGHLPLNERFSESPPSNLNPVSTTDTEDGYCRTDDRYDQITEAIPDWIATEVLPEYINRYHKGLTQDQRRLGYANLFRGECDGLIADERQSSESQGVHPTNEIRVNQIILVHPEVRRQMGCEKAPTDAIYCSGAVRDSVPKVESSFEPSSESKGAAQ